jgi:hypothetical protein
MGKKKEGHERGVGPYAGNDVKLRQIPHPCWETKDINRNGASKIDGGFSGKLPNND